MRFKVQFIIINNMLTVFSALLFLFMLILFFLVWFFRMNITVSGQGEVICAEWVDIKPEVSGIIKSVDVIEGQQVRLGDLLFKLEDRDRRLETEACLQAINEIDNGISNLRKRLSIKREAVYASVSGAESLLKEAEAEYRIVKKGPKTAEIRYAEHHIQRAARQLEKTNGDCTRMEKAFSLKLVSRQELENASHQRRIAQTDLALAEDKLSILLNRYDADQLDVARARVEERRAGLERVRAGKKEIGILEQDIATAEKALASEKKRLAVLERKLRLTKVLSPIDGIVMTYDPERLLGKSVQKGGTVLRVGDTNEYMIESGISERDLPLVKAGQHARVAMKPFPKGEYKLFSARVHTVGVEGQNGGNSVQGLGRSPAEGGSGNGISRENYYPVLLKLEKPYFMILFGNRYEVKPGFSAEVEIVVEDERIALLFFKRVLRLKGVFMTEKIHL